MNDTTPNKMVAYYNTNGVKSKDILGIHLHPHYELFCFLSGQSQYYVDGTLYNMSEGDILLLNKGEFHKATGSLPLPLFRRIIIHFDDDDIIDTPNREIRTTLFDRPSGRFNLFPHSLSKNMPWEHYLRQVVEAKDLHTQRLYLSTVLREMSINFPKLTKSRDAQGHSMEILNYINSKFTFDMTASDNLTIAALCEKFHISHTYLNQLMREMTGTTAGNYIMIKRLHYAQFFLQDGKPPSQVYNQAGFNDYSAFYRAYRNLFGHPPSADYVRKKTDT